MLGILALQALQLHARLIVLQGTDSMEVGSIERCCQSAQLEGEKVSVATGGLPSLRPSPHLKALGEGIIDF